jgi:hypothetical protein
MPLNWKDNYWVKEEPINKGLPELTEYNLRGLFHVATNDDFQYLLRRGIRLTGNNNEFYMLEPFIYFRDDNGIFAIHYNMYPKNDRISYYDWQKASNSWRKFENMYVER